MVGPEQRDDAFWADETPQATLTSQSALTTAAGTAPPDVALADLPSQSADSNFIVSPRGVMILIPLLILAVGIAMTVVGQTALGATSRSMAAERLRQQTVSARQRIVGALGQANPVLDRLIVVGAANASLGEAPAPEALLPTALELRDLVVGRPGITQAYVALVDGRFLSADSDQDGQVNFQITENGVSRVFEIVEQRLVRPKSKPSDYDPRQRDWYQLALERKARAWSEPYAFFFNKTPGVTVVDVVHAPQDDSEITAVVGVDFDVKALTRFMAEFDTRDSHSVLFTEDGVILAYPAAGDTLAQPRENHVPTYKDLDAPVLDGFFAELLKHPAFPAEELPPTTTADARRASQHRGAAPPMPFDVDGKRMLSVVTSLGDNAPNWHLATILPEAAALAALAEYRRSSLAIGGLALAIALLVAWGLARHIIGVREEATKAREAARAARAQAMDLGSYRLVDRLGQGGMGEVWRARHRLLARQAAIKLIKAGDEQSHQKSGEMQERFRREARAIAALRSRNTIELFDYGLTADGTLYYVMELLEGIDLQSLVDRYGAQPAERVRQVLLDACNSLGEAHAVGLVHRDIKPANLFLSRAANEVDVLKVLDFGLVLSPVDGVTPARTHLELNDAAKDLERQLHESIAASPSTLLADGALPSDAERLTRADIQLGTPGFMAPEQALGSKTDGRADLYALGCVAWWLLTAELPFTANTALGMMVHHIQTPLPDLREKVSGPLSQGLEDLILRCMAKQPHDRPSTADELTADLRALGPEPGDWSEEKAHEWWQSQMPRDSRSSALSMVPQKDVHIVPPAASKLPR